jgi:hypothetical protein
MKSKGTKQTVRRKLLTRLAHDVAWAAEGAFGESRSKGTDLPSLIGKEVALNISDYWIRSQEAAPGPIDVIDIFSGCGGMSAGFQAVNGFVPAFHLAMAIDIAPSANATYERNLGITPKHVDVSGLIEEADSQFRETGGSSPYPHRVCSMSGILVSPKRRRKRRR